MTEISEADQWDAEVEQFSQPHIHRWATFYTYTDKGAVGKQRCPSCGIERQPSWNGFDANLRKGGQ